jgi:hypothetical protein
MYRNREYGGREGEIRIRAAQPALRRVYRARASAGVRQSSKIVCNGVLILFAHEEAVQAALREMARIARPGATIWIGEIPEIDEYSYYGMYGGNSMVAFLWHVLRHNELRSFLGMIRRWLKAVVGSEQIILNSAGITAA